MAVLSLSAPQAEPAVVTLACLSKWCCAIEPAAFTDYLEAARGIQFAHKLKGARVRWAAGPALQRQGARLPNDAELLASVTEFSGYTAVDMSTAIDALRYGSARIDSVREVWAAAASAGATDEDLQPVLPARRAPHRKSIVRVRDDPESDEQADAGPTAAPSPTDHVSAMSWSIFPETIVVPRIFAAQCAQDLLHVEPETLEQWDADFRDAALLRDLLNPKAVGYAPRLALAVRAWRDHIYGKPEAVQRALSQTTLESVLLGVLRQSPDAPAPASGWETETAKVIKTPTMSRPGTRKERKHP